MAGSSARPAAMPWRYPAAGSVLGNFDPGTPPFLEKLVPSGTCQPPRWHIGKSSILGINLENGSPFVLYSIVSNMVLF